MNFARAPGRARPVFLRTTAPTPPGSPVAERFDACVRNTGNYFFEESLLRQLPGLAVATGLEMLPRHVPLLVLSMSNFISPSTDLGYLRDALASRRIDQIVMIGAGAQAYTYGDTITLTEGTRRFLCYVADRSVSIGVRGYYTAEVLAELGIRNVQVVGCPSAFWSGHAPAIPFLGPVNRDIGMSRLAVHCTPLGHFRDKVSALMAHGMRHGADYVMQSESWMMPLLGASDDVTALEEGLLYYGYPCCDPAELRDWLTSRLLVFFGIDDWLKQMSQYDFVYGSRFHGNMAAIQAGVPALNMPFDTRTRELCEYLNLPVLPLVEFEADIAMERLREYADFGMFTRTYPTKLRDYAEFLTRNGLEHALPLSEPARRAEREMRVKAMSVAHFMRDLQDDPACSTRILAQGLAERLRPDRSTESRSAAETGCLTAINGVCSVVDWPTERLSRPRGDKHHPALQALPAH